MFEDQAVELLPDRTVMTVWQVNASYTKQFSFWGDNAAVTQQSNQVGVYNTSIQLASARA